jgi:beta-phosphoglucomutase
MKGEDILKAFIFDLDGVIVSTDSLHYRAWKALADSENIYFDEEINNRLRGVSRMESLAIILERATRSYTDEEKVAMAERKNAIYRELLQVLTPNDRLANVTDTLERLRKQGYKLAIGSSSKNTPIILEKIGYSGYFDAISDGNNIKNSKPDPEVFLKAAEFLNLQPQDCFVVEDAEAGIAAAKAGGFTAIGIGSAAQDPNADYAIDSFADLLKIANQ